MQNTAIATAPNARETRGYVVRSSRNVYVVRSLAAARELARALAAGRRAA